ncbi:hypothetical protein JCM19000A_13420 [Silvimonas sp. JCM 19000]
MQSQHINPDEAVQIQRELRARQAVGIHWGTFELADEALDQPALDLAAARLQHGVADDVFFVLRHGQTRILDTAPDAHAASNL